MIHAYLLGQENLPFLPCAHAQGGKVIGQVTLRIHITQGICNSYVMGARDVWHLLHRSPRALCPRVEGNKCHASRVRVI